MLFTSNLRKAVDQYQASPAKTLEQKRAQLIRRHTCGVITETETNSGGCPHVIPPSSVIHKHGLASSGRQVSFKEPFIIEEENEEMIPSAPPPSNPPPPLPPNYAQPPSSNILPPLPAQFGNPPPAFSDDWGEPHVPITPTYPKLPQTTLPNPASAPSLPHQALASTHSAAPAAAPLHDDDFDDDWSDEDEEEFRNDHSKDGDKLSASFVANGNRRRSRSQSRATSGSRTDLSTDDESTAVSVHPSPSLGADNTTLTKVGSKNDLTKEGLTKNENFKETPSGNASAAAPQQRQVSRSRSAGPDTISNSGKPGASRMKTINRFSNFVKSGMESYILTQSKMASEPGEKHEVIIKDGRIMWAPPAQKYTCIVDKPKKESKLKGLKSFIAYSVTSSLTNIQVSRRYKHFDWLHEQLTNKYLLVPIPPLPEKQVSGRYEEDLIEHRKCILQLWVDKICRHPVLSQSEVWQHFITTTDEKKWKNGKRSAEKDEYVGGNFFNCVTVPNQPVDNATADRQIESFIKSVRSLDDSIKNMYVCITETQKRLIGPYKSNWQKMAAAFDSLGQSFQLDHSSAPVKNAIAQSANVLHKIGIQHEEHGKKTTEQLMDFIYTYKGVLSGIPDVVNIHRSAFAKLNHNDRLMMEGKLSPQEADAIHRRVDVITYAMLAEINHISQETNDDFRYSLGTYFTQEAEFYMNIGQQLSKLAEQYKK